MRHQLSYCCGWGILLAAVLGAQEPAPKPADAAPPAAKAAAGPSPLEKIRITPNTLPKRTTYLTTDPMGDPTKRPKPRTQADWNNNVPEERVFKVTQDEVTAKVKVRNDGKLAAAGVEVGVYCLGQMIKDEKLFRVVGKSLQTVDIAPKAEVELRPVKASTRYITDRQYRRGAREFIWVVAVRDAEGRLAALDLPADKEHLAALLPTIEKAADSDEKSGEVTYFSLAGAVADVKAADLDFPPEAPAKK